jgi:hypothetical protein
MSSENNTNVIINFGWVMASGGGFAAFIQWQGDGGMNTALLGVAIVGVGCVILGWIRSAHEDKIRQKQEFDRIKRENQREELIWELWDEVKRGRQKHGARG